MTVRRLVTGVAAAVLLSVLVVPAGRAQAGRAFTTNFTLKIGRASCRERVCQYV